MDGGSGDFILESGNDCGRQRIKDRERGREGERERDSFSLLCHHHFVFTYRWLKLLTEIFA